MAPRASSTIPLQPFNRSSIRFRSPYVRCLSTTSTNQASIPPQSPQYIDIPQPLQPDTIPPRPLKGILPVPRQIFSRPESHEKVTPAYLAATAAEPSTPPSPASQTSSYSSWKAHLAASRRKNLREGLTEILRRKKESDQVRAAQSARRQREHERLVAKPIPEDERLTLPTTLSSQLPSNIRVTDRDRSARLARARANFAAHEARRVERRRDDLHTLYVNAGDYITDKARADALVESEFNDPTKFWDGFTYGENIWHGGYPKTIGERLRRTAFPEVEESLQKERTERLAQALTGGKMRKP